MRTHVPFSLLATALACSVFAAPAHALRARVFVSKNGTDVGACSFTAPCQSLPYALGEVEESGEITILDSGGYNPITITKGVTITVPPGVEAGIAAPAGGTAITIVAASDEAIVLRGLTLTGANSATIGIDVQNEVGKIEIVDCVIRDFQGEGINLFNPVTAGEGTMLVHISNTKVMNNAETGIVVNSNTGGIDLDLNNVTVVDNNKFGISLQGAVAGTIANSDISNNGLFEIPGANMIAGSSPNGAVQMILRNLTLGSSSGISLVLNGYATMFMSQVVGSFLSQQNSSNFVYSDGTNQFASSSNVVPQLWNHF